MPFTKQQTLEVDEIIEDVDTGSFPVKGNVCVMGAIDVSIVVEEIKTFGVELVKVVSVTGVMDVLKIVVVL